MSYKVVKWVFEHGPEQLGDCMVLLGLAEAAEHDGTKAYPGMKRLARYCRMSERAVLAHIAGLIEHGWLVREQRGVRGQNAEFTVIMSKTSQQGEASDTLSGQDRVKRATPFPDQQGEAGRSNRVKLGAQQGEAGRNCSSNYPSIPVLDPSLTRDSSDARPSLTHVHSNGKPLPAVAVRDPEQFETFWTVYPRKVAKQAAEKALTKALKEDSIETIAAGELRWVEYWRNTRTESRYIPYAGTWLNQRRYLEDPGPGPLNGQKPQTKAERSKGVIDEWSRNHGLEPL
jgi:hypothetical protein